MWGARAGRGGGDYTLAGSLHGVSIRAERNGVEDREKRRLKTGARVQVRCGRRALALRRGRELPHVGQARRPPDRPWRAGAYTLVRKTWEKRWSTFDLRRKGWSSFDLRLKATRVCWGRGLGGGVRVLAAWQWRAAQAGAPGALTGAARAGSWTPLHLAAAYGRLEIVKRLHEADPARPWPNPPPPLPPY